MDLGTEVNTQYEKVDSNSPKLFKKFIQKIQNINMKKVISKWKKLFKKFIQKIQFNFELLSGKYLENEGVDNMDDDCEHWWLYVPDWEGDPSLPNGVNDVSYWVCDKCGEETYERPDGIEDDYPGPDFDSRGHGHRIDEAVDYVYDPLRNEP